jgi:oligopeptidase B
VPKNNIKPPIAKKLPYKMAIHNHHRIDNYYWMRDDSRQNKEVLAHLEAENNYAEKILAPNKALEQQLFNELKSRIVKDDKSVPSKDGKYWYHSEICGEQEYAAYYRTSNFAGDDKTLLLDANLRAKAHEFYDLGEFSISPNDKIMTISEDTDSRRIYNIVFKEIDQEHVQNSQENFLTDVLTSTEGQIVWANDNQTVFYVKKDPETLLGTQVYRHKLGTSQTDDVLVYQEDDHSFYLSLGKSRDESLIFICLAATESTDTWCLDANTPNGEFSQLFEHEEQHEYDIDKLGDWFYLVTNWQAKNFRLMKAKVAEISNKDNWIEVIAHRDKVSLEGAEFFNNFIVVTEREQGQIRFIVHQSSVKDQQNTNKQTPLVFDDPCYFACLDDNPEPQSTTARLYYSSLTTPASLYEFDLATGKRTLLKQQKVLGKFAAEDYQSERIFITARDNSQIPVSLVYKKECFNKEGKNPLLQYGYGAYGLTIDPSFDHQTLSLLDRGFVYAIAHIRGGEMLGRLWYEQGKKANKQNTFNDFIDVSKALVAQGYCAENKLFASGDSAGGLLMAAIINQAPELYQGINMQVPFVDILTTMLDESIPLTTNEYDEWGNPNEEKAYQTILAYSPYDNINVQNTQQNPQKSMPNILVTTGLHDSQVQYFEPMKWVAKMREYKTDDKLLIFKTDMDSGHGGASGRFKSLHEKALEMAFFIRLSS